MADYTPYKYNSLMQLLGKGMETGSAGAIQGMKGDQELAKGAQEFQNKQAGEDANSKRLASFFGIDTKEPTPQPDNAPTLTGQDPAGAPLQGPPEPTAQQNAWEPPGDSWQKQLGDELNRRGISAQVNESGWHMGQDPYAKLAAQGPAQAKGFDHTVSGAFAPLHDQARAARNTLEQLDLGTTQGYGQALISEAALSMKGAGGKALGAVLSHLDPKDSWGSNVVEKANFLANHPEILSKSPQILNALRESVFARVQGLKDQAQGLQKQYGASGPTMAPNDYQTILNSHVSSLQPEIDYLTSAQAAYQKQRGANPAAGAPEQYSQPLGFWDRMKRAAGVPSGQPGTAPATDPRARLEELRKKAAQGK